MRALLSLSSKKSLFFLLSTRLPAPISHRITPPLRFLHGSPPAAPSQILQPSSPQASSAADADEEDPMNEFLSRVVHALRPKLSAAFPALPRTSLDAMLLLICRRLASEIDGPAAAAPEDALVELSTELWDAVRDASAAAHEAMHRDRLRAQLKSYLHCDEVKEMCRFAGDVGIRGQLLRELRFKWAREKLDEVEFYRGLEQMKLQADKAAEAENAPAMITSGEDASPAAAVAGGIDSLPQRKGRIRYKIYGLDLSDPEWAEVAERVEEAERHFVPEEAKPVDGKCKMVEEGILGLSSEDDPASALTEWKELLGPRRVDWLALLERIKKRNVGLYFKVAELILTEESFEANIRDYSRLIDMHSKADRVEDAERILHKMTEKGIMPDVLTYIILVHMYSKAGNLERAKEAFESLREQGFQPDLKTYSSMIMAYVKAGLPKSGESLMREMETRGIQPTKEIYLEVLRAFAECGQVDGAQRIVNTMQLAGIPPTLESSTLLVEAYAQAGDPDQARGQFDHMMRAGHKPDDRCTASMIEAYVKKNLLDKALDLLLNLEKDGFQPGVRTYSVLVDWLGRLQLVDEVERLLKNIAEKGDTPFEIHVSLCDMYSKAHQEDKARKSLKILLARKELLKADQFERIVIGLLAGGLVEDAKRIYDAMQKQGFTPSEPTKVAIMAAQSIPRQRSFRKGGKA